MGDIWNKIDEEMSKPRISGYDVMGPVGVGIQGAKALTKAMDKKKNMMYGGPGSKGYVPPNKVAESLVEESQRSRAKRKVGQNETGFKRVPDDSFPNGRLVAKPKINLRKEYKD